VKDGVLVYCLDSARTVLCVFSVHTMVQHDGIAVLGCINLPDVTWVGNNICCINEATRTEGAFGESIIYLEHAILFWTQYSLLSTGWVYFGTWSVY
jgi:hypothetical protein